MTSHPILAGRHILLVEDDFFVAHDLTLSLQAAGAVVVGPVSSLASGRTVIRRTSRLDGAIMDINLGGELSYELIDMLLARDVPVTFATGYDRQAVPARYRDIPLCEKPLDMVSCAKALFA